MQTLTVKYTARQLIVFCQCWFGDGKGKTGLYKSVKPKLLNSLRIYLVKLNHRERFSSGTSGSKTEENRLTQNRLQTGRHSGGGGGCGFAVYTD